MLLWMLIMGMEHCGGLMKIVKNRQERFIRVFERFRYMSTLVS